MSATIKLSDKSCFLCGKTNRTYQLKIRDADFQGVLCEEHMWKVMNRENGEKPGNNVENVPKGGVEK